MKEAIQIPAVGIGGLARVHFLWAGFNRLRTSYSALNLDEFTLFYEKYAAREQAGQSRGLAEKA